jgi:hypothetical protein
VVLVAFTLEVAPAVLVLHVQHEMDLVLDQIEVAVDAELGAGVALVADHPPRALDRLVDVAALEGHPVGQAEALPELLLGGLGVADEAHAAEVVALARHHLVDHHHRVVVLAVRHHLGAVALALVERTDVVVVLDARPGQVGVQPAEVLGRAAHRAFVEGHQLLVVGRALAVEQALAELLGEELFGQAEEDHPGDLDLDPAIDLEGDADVALVVRLAHLHLDVAKALVLEMAQQRLLVVVEDRLVEVVAGLGLDHLLEALLLPVAEAGEGDLADPGQFDHAEHHRHRAVGVALDLAAHVGERPHALDGMDVIGERLGVEAAPGAGGEQEADAIGVVVVGALDAHVADRPEAVRRRRPGHLARTQRRGGDGEQP